MNQTTKTAGIDLDRDQVVEMMLKNDMLTQIGYRALLNGDSLDADLNYLTRLANLARRSTSVSDVCRRCNSARPLHDLDCPVAVAASGSDTAAYNAQLRQEVSIIYQMLDDGEWAEHIATTAHGQNLETAITKLVGKASGSDGTAAAGAEGRNDDRATWNTKQWYEHVGAWETPEGFVSFGSIMAVRAMMIQYGCVVSASVQERTRVDAARTATTHPTALTVPAAGAVCQPLADERAMPPLPEPFGTMSEDDSEGFFTAHQMRSYASAALAQQAGAPADYKLVPLKLTDEMRAAACGIGFAQMYEAAIAAAPAPAAQDEQDAKDAALPVELMGVREEMASGSGFWSSCSGCYDTEDGHPTGNYSYSRVFGCALGSGCSECGGLGAVWDNTDYEAMAQDLAKDEDRADMSQSNTQADNGTDGAA